MPIFNNELEGFCIKSDPPKLLRKHSVINNLLLMLIDLFYNRHTAGEVCHSAFEVSPKPFVGVQRNVIVLCI